jgi:hypothetical protein
VKLDNSPAADNQQLQAKSAQDGMPFAAIQL